MQKVYCMYLHMYCMQCMYCMYIVHVQDRKQNHIYQTCLYSENQKRFMTSFFGFIIWVRKGSFICIATELFLKESPEAEFKEFKYGWSQFKLYSMFQDLSRRSTETGFWWIWDAARSLNVHRHKSKINFKLPNPCIFLYKSMFSWLSQKPLKPWISDRVNLDFFLNKKNWLIDRLNELLWVNFMQHSLQLYIDQSSG